MAFGESILWMTVIDGLIIAVPLYLFYLFTEHYQELDNLGLTLGTNFILAGLIIIAIFYFTDILIMHLMPLFITRQSVIAAMIDLHLHWSWLVNFTGIGLIGFGVAYLLNTLVPRINRTINKLESTITFSEKKFRNIFMETSVGYALINKQQRIIEINDSFCSMLGYTRNELVDTEFRKITPPEDLDDSLNNHNRIFSGELKTYQTEKQYIHKQGHNITAKIDVSIVPDETDKPLYAIVQVQNITEIRQLSERLSHQTCHDNLTDLINRQEFQRRLKRVLATSMKEKSEHVLCYMDMDQFKVVNDTCGHSSGDELLCKIAGILQSKVRKRDTLARLGGDEFGILMEYCNLDQARQVALSLQKAIQELRFECSNSSFNLSVSMGLVSINEFSSNDSELLKEADVACFMAKESGRNRIHIYHPEDEELVQKHGEMHWVSRINQALEEDHFQLYAQPIVPLKGENGSFPHYEFLVRMEEKDGTIIPPGIFLPAAERYNLITRIDQWVISKSFSIMKTYPDIMSQLDFCSINISGQSLTDPDFLEFVVHQLEENSINAAKVCFEITETSAISNLGSATRFISTLKKFGCQFALDDFGSGLSSFAYLKNLNVDYLKIDGMFVKDIVHNEVDYAMVKMINELGHVMGMQTIAEFVEDETILGMLSDIGVDNVQGYGVGKPMPSLEIFYDIGTDKNEHEIVNKLVL